MKILFILITLNSINFWSIAYANIDDYDSLSSGIFSTVEDSDDQLINFSNFKEELNFLEKKSSEVTSFLEKDEPQNKSTEQVDEISLNSSAIKKTTINENNSSNKSEEQVNDLINQKDLKVRPRRIRQR